jgi:hypothetical protein
VAARMGLGIVSLTEGSAMRDEFSVHWWDRDGGYHEELRLASAKAALQALRRLTVGPTAMLGMVQRVMITDGDHYCNYEWRDGRVIWEGQKAIQAEMIATPVRRAGGPVYPIRCPICDKLIGSFYSHGLSLRSYAIRCSCRE